MQTSAVHDQIPILRAVPFGFADARVPVHVRFSVRAFGRRGPRRGPAVAADLGTGHEANVGMSYPLG